MSRCRPVRAVFDALVWVIRGTPLVLQLIIIFYGPGLWLGRNIWGSHRMLACIVAFVLNYACYFSVIYRGGIQAIPAGQREAGQVLGMTRRQIFFRVTLLQVIKRILPPMSNEIITLVKDTSLAQDHRHCGADQGRRGLCEVRRDHLAPVLYRDILSAVRGAADAAVPVSGAPSQLFPVKEAAMAYLSVENLEKAFGGTRVLRDVSFQLPEGETLSVIGSSGSGKTTLLRCLNFLERPDGGVISLRGEPLLDASRPPERERALRRKRLHFGLVFQDFNLFPQYTALENVTLARRLARRDGETEQDIRRGLGAAGPDRPVRPGRALPSSALRRPEAACGHRPCAWSRTCCASTSPPPPWTRSLPARCCGSSASWPAAAPP